MKYAALAVASLFAGCHHGPPPVMREPQQRLSRLTLSQSQRGVPLWTLDAQKAVLADVEDVATVSEPRMQFYKDGKLASRLAADGGTVHLGDNDVMLSSHVVVTSLEDRSTLRTSELLFSSSKKKFYTDKEVLVQRPGGTLRGRGLEAAPDLSEFRIYNQRSEIRSPEGLR